MTTKKERAILALIRSPTIEAAAQQAHIGYSTLRRWLREDQEFQQAYRTALSELVKDADAQARRGMSNALSTLTDVMENGESDAAKVSAARSMLEYSLKLVEIADVQERLEAVEAALAEGGDRA